MPEAAAECSTLPVPPTRVSFCARGLGILVLFALEAEKITLPCNPFSSSQHQNHARLISFSSANEYVVLPLGHFYLCSVVCAEVPRFSHDVKSWAGWKFRVRSTFYLIATRTRTCNIGRQREYPRFYLSYENITFLAIFQMTSTHLTQMP